MAARRVDLAGIKSPEPSWLVNVPPTGEVDRAGWGDRRCTGGDAAESIGRALSASHGI